MARRKSFTKKRRALFLEQLREHGNVSEAAATIDISRRHLNRLRKADDEFDGEWEDADMFFLDRIAADLAKRGEKGEDRQKIRRKGTINAEGEFKATEEIREQSRVKSTAAAIATLRARHPDYKLTQALEVSGADGGPIRIQPTGFDWDLLTYAEKKEVLKLLDKATPADPDASAG